MARVLAWLLILTGFALAQTPVGPVDHREIPNAPLIGGTNGTFVAVSTVTPAMLAKPLTQALTQQPSPLGNWSSLSTAFTGDLSHVTFAISHRIDGAATLQQPATGYKYTEEAYPIAGYLVNTSGWNQNLGTNDGRTGAAFARVHVIQNGQGDAVAYNATCSMGSTLAGATSFLAEPACVLFNGDEFPTANGQYLNPYEVHLTDQGHDVAAVGLVNNFIRTNATGALGAFWAGSRMQSQGSVAADVAYSATGKWNFGLDLSGGAFQSAALGTVAISTKRDQCWYGNANGIDSNPSGIYRYPSAVNTDFICNSSSINGWILGAANNSSLQITGGQVTINNVFAHTNVEKDLAFQVQTPTTGFSITASDAWSTLMLDPAGTLASGTITMPPTPSNGRIFNISSTQTVTSLTLSPNAGQTNKCTASTITAGGRLRCIYQTSNSAWYPY